MQRRAFGQSGACAVGQRRHFIHSLNQQVTRSGLSRQQVVVLSPKGCTRHTRNIVPGIVIVIHALCFFQLPMPVELFIWPLEKAMLEIVLGLRNALVFLVLGQHCALLEPQNGRKFALRLVRLVISSASCPPPSLLHLLNEVQLNSIVVSFVHFLFRR